MDTGGIFVHRDGRRLRLRVTGFISAGAVADLCALALSAEHADVDLAEARLTPEATELLLRWQRSNPRHLVISGLAPAEVAPDPPLEEPSPPLPAPVALADLLAHELRSPLTAAHIRLQALEGTLLQRGLVSEAEECRRVVAALDLLSGLLEIYLPSGGRWETRKLDLGDLCAVLARRAPALPGPQRVDLVVPELPLWVSGEPRALSQALWNLVRNGLEAAGPEGRVRLELGSTEGPRPVQVVVTNSGLNFPTDLLREPLKPRRSSKSGGMGIGLVIADWIIRRHGGHLLLQNIPDGARVVVRLPGAHPSSHPSDQNGTAQADSL